MRLPDFTDDAGLIALRRSMGAEAPGSFSTNYRPDELSLAELKQLATEGKNVSIDDVVVLDDGTLNYKDSRVVVYIRDVIAYGSHQDDPRFHVADCTTLRRMRQVNRSGRYVVTTRGDGRFLVNRVSNHNKISNHEIPLKICQNCLNMLAFDNFSFSLSPGDRTKIVSRFTIDRFLKNIQSPSFTGDQRETRERRRSTTIRQILTISHDTSGSGAAGAASAASETFRAQEIENTSTYITETE